MAAIDLSTLDAVKERAEVSSTNDDQEIQDAITGFSQYLLTRTGVASFNTVASYLETRDGNGADIMYVRNPPIVNVAAVVVFGISIPQAGPWPNWGYYVSDDARSIKIRSGSFPPSNFSYYTSYNRQKYAKGFPAGQGNVALSYFGGYTAVPYDLEYAVRCVVAINYKRKAWQDLDSKSQSVQGGSSTTRYRNWAWPPEYETVFRYYQRLAVI